MSSSRSLQMVFLASLAVFNCRRAQAELGGPAPTVRADGARMGARMSSLVVGRMTRHTLTRPNGGTVQELTNASGQVFAVSWSGPGKPDLRTLLGRYFPTYQAASVPVGRVMRSLRRPLQVNQPDIQIQTAGHMGWFRGVALVPSLAPAGFSLGDLAEVP